MRVGDVVERFPELNLDALEVQESTRLELVNDFTAQEIAIKIGKLRFDEATEVKAALSLWYLEGGEEQQLPLVAEFSFDYDAPEGTQQEDLETFPQSVVLGANRLFQSLQKQAGWISPNFTTKTAFAYEGL